MLGPPHVPVVKDLVLLGGGHSHLAVLRSFGMRPLAGVRLTLVTRDMHTPYSGMLPGYVSGFYTYDECHIDLARLATFARARLIHAEASGIDAKERRILFDARPSIPYDVLSIDIGSTPGSDGVPGALQYATAVKPINKFVAKFDGLMARVRATDTPLSVVVVGGGAGGVELAMALQHRLKQAAEVAGTAQPSVTLVSRGPILGRHPTYARNAVRRLMAEAGMHVHEGQGVAKVREGVVELHDGGHIPFDECLWCTQAHAAAWLKGTSLPLDDGGFLAINEYLQSDGGPPEVFAAGDVASSAQHPRPKSGVIAVRQGAPLADNLRRYLTGQQLRSFVPQSTSLALISAGRPYAVGTKGWLAFEGAWAWTLKDWIDRAFMHKFGRDLPFKQMQEGAGMSISSSAGASTPPVLTAAGPEALALLAAARMRCGGCGAKVGASVLTRALKRVQAWQQQQEQQQQQELVGSSKQQQPLHACSRPQQQSRSEYTGGAGEHNHQRQQQQEQQGQQQIVILGIDSPDDAAVVEAPPPGHVLVQTVDFFRSFWDDPYIFGRIAANHALGDCFAMGAQPATALAIAVVPFGPDAQQEEALVQLLAGAVSVLQAAGCALVGGHSSEGAETALGFSIYGHVQRDALLRKGGLAPGQALLLTKPLGTGIIMAAAMRGAAKGRWVAAALDSMQQSSGPAAAVLQAHGCAACTDVTGFGLAGHMVEMARASEEQVYIQLDLDALPMLPGAQECIQAGTLSSLHTANARVAASIDNFEEVVQDERWPILVDPQTAGGLLAAMPEADVALCISALEEGGTHAVVVGHVHAGSDDTGLSLDTPDDDAPSIKYIQVQNGRPPNSGSQPNTQ